MDHSRRGFLLGAAGLGAALLDGCTPVRFLFHADEPDLDRPGSAAERTLRAFVTTVIPGAAAEDPSLTRVYFDERFPFRKVAGFFAADLTARARSAFDTVDPETRTRVVQQGLASNDALVARMYQAAVFAAQVSFFGGIYGRGGCGLIDFPGPNPGYPAEVQFHPDARALCAPGITSDGNVG